MPLPPFHRLVAFFLVVNLGRIITKELFDKVQEKIANYFVHQICELLDQIFLPHVSRLAILVLEPAAAVVDVTVNIAVLLLLEFFVGRYARPAQPASHEFREGEFFSLATYRIDLDEIGMKERIKIEIERHKKFQSGLLGIKEQSVKVGDVDVRNYAKYILRDGTIFEKRELLTCLRSKITMAKKEIRIA